MPGLLRHRNHGVNQMREDHDKDSSRTTAALSVSVARVRQHIAFLERIHDDPINSQGQLYTDRQVLTAAVARYEKQWLPLVACNPGKVLVPPIDVSWVWHLHRLAPLRYAAYCRENFCDILDPDKAAFRMQSGGHPDEQDEPECLETRDIWAR